MQSSIFRGFESTSFSLFIALAAGCGSIEPINEQPTSKATQPVYYGWGSPGTIDNSTCGPHSAVGYLEMSGGNCSGTLVRNNIVITAHHCNVAIGDKFGFKGTSNADKFTVTKISLAPNWDGPVQVPGPGDMAVLQLDRAVPRYMYSPTWLLIASRLRKGLSRQTMLLRT